MARRPNRKLYKVGTYVLGSTAGFAGNQWFDIVLDTLPEYLVQGFKAYVEEFEIKLTLTLATRANDPTLQSVYLHYLLDSEVYGPGNYRVVARKGWHDPLWSMLQEGRIYGTRCLDLPATGGSPGSYARTFTKHIRFVDDYMANPASRNARVIPSIAFAKSNGKLRVYAHAAQEVIKAVGVTISALQLDVYAHLVDYPASMCFLPVLFEEQSNDGLKDTNPGPDIGAYLRLMMANSPQYAVAGWANGEDLSVYTSLDLFGDAGNYTIIDRPVDVHLRQFLEDVLREPHIPFQPAGTPSAATPTARSEYRYVDPFENFSGKTPVIPLVYTRGGDDIADVPRWYGKKPTLKANNNVTTGLPTSVDMIFQRIVARDQKWVTAIMGAVSPRALSQQPRVPAAYMVGAQLKPGVDVTRIPLTFSGM